MIDSLIQYLAPGQADDLVFVSFGFQVPIPFVFCIVVLFATAITVGFLYWRHLNTTKLSLRRRFALLSLRVFAITLAIALLMDPSIITQHIRPGDQIVALLFDDSMSMQIGGSSGESRGDRLVREYNAAQETFEDEIQRKHRLVRYRVGDRVEPLKSVSELNFDKKESNLLDGVGQVFSDLEGTTVSGVVLFSDGVQQADSVKHTVESLSGRSPVYTVGVDTLSKWTDIELSHLSVKRTEFDKSPVVVTAGVRSQGLSGQNASVIVRLGERVIQRVPVQIDKDVQDLQVRMEFVPDRKEWIDYVAEVVVDESAKELDRIQQNNSRTFVVDNRDKEYRILYIAGRPNWEYKFLSRALKQEAQFDFDGLVCISTAEPKFEFRGKKSTLSNPLFEGIDPDEDQARYDEAVFLRFGVGEDELVSGIPTSADELFSYDLIILGDIEREYFTTRQLELLRDFVDVRGGALLVQGGANGFTEGGYAGSPIENLFPVVLYGETDRGHMTRGNAEFRVEPTVDGVLAGVWSLDLDENQNAQLWAEMPPLYGMNYFPITRAGATVMAEGRESDQGDANPLFALQRYGEGLTGILATGETWQWQMRLESEDDRHERLWRQIVRYMVYQKLDRVRLRAKRDEYTQFLEHPLEFIVRNEEYIKQEALQCTLVITDPDGVADSVAVDESLEEIGLYRANFAPEMAGLHTLTLVAMGENDEVVGRFEETLLVEEDRSEFQMAQYSPRFLENLSQGTGGARFELSQLDQLAAAIPLPVHQESDTVVLHLWHIPLFYILFILCLPLEWYLRRRRGLA